MSGIDRNKRACEAIDRIADGFKTLACIWLEAQAEAQAVETGSRIVTEIAPAQQGARLMTIKDLADYLQVTPRTIRGWINNQGLPTRYAGDDPRFDLAEVSEWTKRHQKNNRVTMAGNGRIAPAPSSGTRPQATQRRG